MIPQIDQDIGISVYTTKYPSINGKIKQNENDFSVNEVLSEKTLLSFDITLLISESISST